MFRLTSKARGIDMLRRKLYEKVPDCVVSLSIAEKHSIVVMILF